MVTEVPLRVVAVEVVSGQRRSTVGSRIQHECGVDTLTTRNHLRHDTEGTVDELLNAPELLGITSELRNRCYLSIGSSSECTMCTLDLDLTYSTCTKGPTMVF